MSKEETTSTGSAKGYDGDAIIAEAKRRSEAGEELGAHHVRAIERPQDYAGQTIPRDDSDKAEDPTKPAQS